ncbi:MAG: putative DNA binding domain-containing protein [Bacteroidales bacterium]|nr:putative DNA binding domain-containing protein [Bacteroidales bacterium]
MVKENQNIEFKESWRDEYLKWICGFANAQGGKIYIGVNDNGTVCGIQNCKKLLEDIPNKVRDTMGIVVDVNILESDNKEYLEIVVYSSTYPVSYHGEYHYRSGSTKQQLQGSALTEFLIKKTGYQWDAVPVDWVGIDDLDKESFDIFRREAVRTGRMSVMDVNCSNQQLLDKLGLIDNGKLKRAAVLLFYRYPQRFVTGCYVKIGKFPVGNSAELLYQDTVEGSLMLMADRTIDLIYLKYLTASISYHHDVRVETYPYAREAVREAVYNALIHTKWQDGIPIQIRVQDDVMYISNQCSFPTDWTIADLLKPHRSRPYNPQLAATFYRAGYIESWGRGIEKIETECKTAGAEPPQYEVKGDGFTVKFDAMAMNEVINEVNEVINGENEVIKRDNGGINGGIKLSEKENLILKAISANSKITTNELVINTSIPKRTVEYIIHCLRDKGVITRQGSNKTGYWIVKVAV